MQIDISGPPDPDIFRDRKKNAICFFFFLAMACGALGMGIFAIYSATRILTNFEDWALGILVGSSLGITRYGNRLQAYKRLYPPQLKKLTELRESHPTIEHYCTKVEAMGRRLIRAEYEAFIEYAEKHSAIPFI